MVKLFRNSENPQVNNLWKLIGNTPFLAIRYTVDDGAPEEVLVKCEQYNLTGSIKDRIALYVLQKAIEQQQIKPGDLIVEASSGNTGIAFAAIGRIIGHRVRIIAPEAMSFRRRSVIKDYGAEVQVIGLAEGGYAACIRAAEAMAHYENMFLPRQLESRYTIEAHEKTTGREIGHSLILEKIKPAALIACTGSGGTLMGVGKYLRTLYPEIRVHPLELTGGLACRLPGIGGQMVQGLADPGAWDSPMPVSSADGVLMAQKIATELGLHVGFSGGANLIGAIRLQQQIGKGKKVITLFPDSSKYYSDEDGYAQDGNESELASRIRLLGSRVLNNV